MKSYTQTNKAWNSKGSWTCLRVLFETLFYLTKLLNLTMVRNFEIILGQTLKQYYRICLHYLRKTTISVYY
jgi:hypothetical protein